MSETNAAATLSYLLSHRLHNAKAWVVPRWSSPISAGIFPIGVIYNDRFIPLGTAFAISKLGTVATALHNIKAAFEYDRLGSTLLSSRELPKEASLTDAGIAVLHSEVVGHGRASVNIWPLESCDGAPPTDLAFGSPSMQPALRTLPLPLSFVTPRVGSKVYCVGYGEMRYPEGGISLADLRAGRLDDLEKSVLDIHVVEGYVSNILTKGVAVSFPTGPCLIIDGLVKHGQSGGPVFNEDGFVCGIVCAGASLFMPDESSVVSLLYPALLHPVKSSTQLGPVRLTTKSSLIDQILLGTVITDGSETSLPLTEDQGQLAVGVKIHSDDAVRASDDMAGLHADKRATRIEGPRYQLKRHNAGNTDKP